MKTHGKEYCEYTKCQTMRIRSERKEQPMSEKKIMARIEIQKAWEELR